MDIISKYFEEQRRRELDSADSREPAAVPFQEISAVLQSFVRCRALHTISAPCCITGSQEAKKHLMIKTDIDTSLAACGDEARAERMRLLIELVAHYTVKHSQMHCSRSKYDPDTGITALNVGNEDDTTLSNANIDAYMQVVESILQASPELQQSFAQGCSYALMNNYDYDAFCKITDTKRMRTIVSDPDYKGDLGVKRARD